MSSPYIQSASGELFDVRNAADIRRRALEHALPRRYVPVHALRPQGAAP